MTCRSETVIVRHPAFGTLALHECQYVDNHVEGCTYNFNTPTGDGCIKEWFNFPVTCIVPFQGKRDA